MRMKEPRVAEAQRSRLTVGSPMRLRRQWPQTSFTFHLALVQSTYPEFRVGGGRVGANSVVLSQVDRDPQCGITETWGRQAVHGALDPDLESLPLCRLPDVVYLDW